MLCADVARRARAEPPFGLHEDHAQGLNQIPRGRLKSCAIVDDNHFAEVGSSTMDRSQGLHQKRLAIISRDNHRVCNARIAHLFTLWLHPQP